MFKKEKLSKKLDEINETISKSNLDEIAYILGNRKQIFIRNLIAGISRGIGIGIGITVITAILVVVLQKIILLNIPVISEYLADILQIVKQRNL